MVAARLYRRGQPTRSSTTTSMMIWSGLSFLPDADVVGFALGVAYGDPWGHRGATHSIAFSIGLGVLIGLFGVVARWPVARTAITASLVLVSHALLDTLTDGGLGCGLLWPFDLTRYFAPWQPIPVAPIGPWFFSARGMQVAFMEVMLFAPLLLYALWPRRRRD